MDGGGQNFGAITGGNTAIYSATQPSQKPKNRQIFLVFGTIIFLIIIALGTFLGTTLYSTSNAETYSKLRNFYYVSSYQDLVDLYDSKIGLSPSLKANRTVAFFPLSQDFLNDLKNRVSIIEDSIKSVPNSVRIKPDIENSLNDLKHNINTLSDFYNAFVIPIHDAYVNKKAILCEKSSDMNTLFSNKLTESAAEAYFNLYCEVAKVGIESYARTIEEPGNLSYESAVLSLNSTLKTVTDLRPKIETILRELEK